MTALRHYKNPVYDSARWAGFRFRDGDIVISTPPKCGTTWMQTLCAMLVLNSVTFDRRLEQISPWLDMQNKTLASVVASLEAQQHRRIIKTHTPLDGLPYDERVTYVCVGRDPRDVALSFEHHMANLDMDAFIAARATAVGLEDLAEFGPLPGPPSPDPVERFWTWANAQPGSSMGPTLANILQHLQTFWNSRQEPNIALFHYSDLLADLPDQLRRLSDSLRIHVTDQRISEFAAAGTFACMRQRADDLVPDGGNPVWLSNREFFHRGESGQWRDLLDEPGLLRYAGRVAKLAPPDLAAWAHNGWHGADTPR